MKNVYIPNTRPHYSNVFERFDWQHNKIHVVSELIRIEQLKETDVDLANDWTNGLKQNLLDSLTIYPNMNTDPVKLVDDIVLISYQGMKGEQFAKRWLREHGWFVAQASVEWDYKGVDMCISRPDRRKPIYIQVKPLSAIPKQTEIVKKMYHHLDWVTNEIGIFYFTWELDDSGMRVCKFVRLVVDPANVALTLSKAPY